MRVFSDLTLKRLKQFKSIKRAYYSLLILSFAFLLSLFAEFFAGDRPLYIRYQDQSYFPVLNFYPASEFGGKYKTEANYLKLAKDPDFSKNSMIIFPLIPHDPRHTYLDEEGQPPQAPSLKHWWGTDEGARDVLSRIIHGFRSCMLFSLILTFSASTLGILIGGIQGYFGGKIDFIGQRVIEIWGSLPFLYVVIVLGSIYGRSFFVLIGVMSLFSWIGMSLYMRGEFLKLKNMNYVKSAQAMGLSTPRIFFKHILPNGLTPVVTLVPFLIISGISSLTTLDFLGFGVPPPDPSWGELISQGLRHHDSPWITISVVGSLFCTLLMAAFIGEGAREAFDPKSES